MEADFDLGRLDEIPDVLPADQRDLAPPPPPAGRTSPEIAGPPRARVRSQRLVAVMLSLAWLLLQVAVLGFRTDFARLGVAYPVAQIALPAVLSSLALGFAVWPGPTNLGASVGSLRAVTLAGLLGMTGVALFWPLPFPYTPPAGGLGFGQWLLVCADIVAVMGTVPLALAAFVLRRSFPAAAGDRSAAVGAACGLGAVTAMHLHCENIEPVHVAIAHMIPAGALAVIGALILRHLTRA